MNTNKYLFSHFRLFVIFGQVFDEQTKGKKTTIHRYLGTRHGSYKAIGLA